MSQPEENIYHSIKSGEYFKKALDWYNIIYVYPVVQRTLFITITFVCVISIIIAVFAFYSFLPVVRNISVAVGVDELSDEYVQIKELNEVEDANLALMTYLINTYITARESYNFSDISKNMNLVKKYSSANEFSKFAYSMNIRNPDSIILKYKQNAMVVISINSTVIERKKHDLTEKNVNPDERVANIMFARTEITFAGKRTTKVKAVIDFNYKDMKFDKKTQSFIPLDLSVQNYKVSELPENSKK